MRVAVIGMGTMGAPMAANLLKAGHEVVVHNRSRAREEPLAQLGARRAASPAAAADGADVLVTCVSDTPDVEAVLLDLEQGAIRSLRRGSLVIDCSTIAPRAARRLAATFAGHGVGFVDAPVSGGSEGAIRGTLAIMCGGTAADFERAQPILEALGRAITHVGPAGCGQIAKAVNQIIISGVYQSVAEGLVFAARAGADVGKVLQAIEKGAAASWILTNRSGNMRSDHYPLGFRLRLHRKDLAIALDEARSTGVPLPVASYVATVEDGLIGQGYGDEDLSAVARAVRRNAGVPDGDLSAASDAGSA